MEVFDGLEFDKWVDKASAPAIESSLKLYEEVLRLGFKVFLLTGRSEKQRSVTVENLVNVGFHDWDKLILRSVLKLFLLFFFFQIVLTGLYISVQFFPL